MKKSLLTQLTDRDLPLAYLVLRWTMAVNMIPHGGMRFQFLDKFATGVAEQFAEVAFMGVPLMPYQLAYSYAILLCFVEFTVGVLLLIGWEVRRVSALGGLMMVTLMFGKSIQGDWGTAGSMWLYVFAFFLLTALNTFDRYLNLDKKA